MRSFLRLLLSAVMLLAVTSPARSQIGSASERTSEPPAGTWRDRYTLPTWGIKTNLLYDATTTMNLGFEIKTGRKNSIDIPVSWNPWEFRNGVTKIKHILVQPEFRWWPNGTFNGNFFGLHGHYAFYNVGGLPHGPFSQYMKDHRFQGWLAGAGVSWGYRWNFNRHWALEITFGIGYAYLDYDKYPCGECGVLIAEETKHYFGPTKAGVNLIFNLGSKKKKPVPVQPVVIAVPEPEPVIYDPVLRASYVVPETEAVKSRSESGEAYLEFVVGRSEILPDFRNNAAELDKIHSTIRLVNGDPDVTIRNMILTGYASPEGSYASNMALSQRRANALREYLQNIYGFFGGRMTSMGAGEDWATLGALVDQSYIMDKYAILSIINGGTADYDIRERQLMAVDMGEPYRMIKAEMYPKLRRTDYVIEYDVAPIDIARGKEVLRTRPGNLSLNEMYLIANTYAPGSPEFVEVFEIAARVFPDSDVANINAAASALNRGDIATAEAYLGKVKNRDAAWYNNMGMLHYLRGDAAKAAEHMRQGGSTAAANLAEIEKHLRSLN